MLELNGWGPLLALWIGGAVHLTWIVRRERRESDSTGVAISPKKAA